jgi:C1A family cysteine protease
VIHLTVFLSNNPEAGMVIAITKFGGKRDWRPGSGRRATKVLGDGSAPATSDLREHMPEINDQKSLSCCTGEAITSAVRYLELSQGRPDLANPSVLFTYFAERLMEGDVGQDGGAVIADGIASLRQYGVCPDSLWPFSEGNVLVRPPQACFDAATKLELKNARRVPQDKASWMHVLGVLRLPIVFGIACYESLQSDETTRTGDIPMPSTGEEQDGGHCILAAGYDATHVLIRNSWGTGVGVGGYYRLPWEYAMDRSLSDDCWVVAGF